MGLRELKPFVRRQRRPHFVALETKHSRKRIRHADIVIDDQDAGSGRAVVGGRAAQCGAARQRRQGAEDGLCYIQAASTGLSPALHSYVLSSELVLSPILVRPVREQLEHDRVIRLLQAKYKRKFEVAINPGNEQTVPVGMEASPWYPDLVLQSTDKNRRLLGVVEVETTESVNHLEAMSQWGAFSRLRVAFHLYVPLASVDSARRLCTDLQISTTEVWAFHSVGDQIRFALVHRVPQPGDGKTVGSTQPAPARAAGAARPASPPERVVSSGRPAPARTRTAAPAAARPARRTKAAPATARRTGAAKAKTTAPRRASPKPARKSASRSSGAAKR